MEIEELGMFQQFEKGASTIKTIVMVAVLCVVFVLSSAFGASAFGFRQLGDPAPSLGTGGGIDCKTWDNFVPEYQKIFTDAANQFGIQPALVGAIFLAEHGGNGKAAGPWATSSADAMGPFQFKQGTWDEYGKGGNVQDINDAAIGAANYLSQILIKHVHLSPSQIYNLSDLQIRSVAIAYNGGPSYYQQWRDSGYDDSKLENNGYKNILKYFNGLNKGCDSTASSDTINGKQDKKFDQKYWQQTWINNKAKVKQTMKPQGVVLHWTAGGDVKGAISAMTNRECYVHLIIDKDGSVYQLLPFDSRVTCGSEKGNSFAIAIEIVSVASSSTQENEDALLNNPAQFKAVTDTIKYLIDTYKIPNIKGDNDTQVDAHQGIFGHYQVSTTGKQDPGKQYMKDVWGELGSKES